MSRTSRGTINIPHGQHLLDTGKTFTTSKISEAVADDATLSFLIKCGDHSINLSYQTFVGGDCFGKIYESPTSQANYQKIIDRDNYYNKTLKVAVKVQNSNTANQFSIAFYDGATYRGTSYFNGTTTTTSWQVLEFTIPWNVNIDRIRLGWLPKYNNQRVRVDDIKITP